MQRSPESKDRLLPLRRFAVHGLYDAAYLSLLVQRKTLRAKKIGRNYFTTAAWFEEYLEIHARDEIRIAYGDKLKVENNKSKVFNNNLIDNFHWFGFSRSEKPGFFSWKKILATLVVTSTVLLLLFYSWRMIYAPMEDSKGIVAGISETK